MISIFDICTRQITRSAALHPWVPRGYIEELNFAFYLITLTFYHTKCMVSSIVAFLLSLITMPYKLVSVCYIKSVQLLYIYPCAILCYKLNVYYIHTLLCI